MKTKLLIMILVLLSVIATATAYTLRVGDVEAEVNDDAYEAYNEELTDMDISLEQDAVNKLVESIEENHAITLMIQFDILVCKIQNSGDLSIMAKAITALERTLEEEVMEQQ